MDDVLRMNHVQAVGTHNSYHVDPANGVPPWSYTHRPLDEQLEEQGVRQFELDLYYYGFETPSHFEVFHLPSADDETTCRMFVDCLRRLADWSDAHPAHHPIVILLEPKDDFDPALAEAYFERLEADVASAFPAEKLITPDLVRGDAATLREAILGRGWPTLGEVRGRAMFVLLDSGGHRQFYTHGGANLDGRLFFTQSRESDPFAAVLLIDDVLVEGPRIRAAVEQGFLVRTRADVDGEEARANDRTRADAALASGAQMISTDYPAPHPTTGYVVRMPDGTPSRCNPIVAPGGCSPLAVEDPAFLR